MIRIMIVDDEILFREYLRTSIQWGNYGFSICAEARNGLEALEMMEKEVPDILLLDINMPFMDGITLSEQVRERNYKTELVIITGYGEFEYAQRALKLGVVDFILKPFEKEELLMTLIKIKNRIMSTAEEKRTVRENMDLLRETFLNRLIESEIGMGEEQVDKTLEYLGYRKYLRAYLVSSIEIDDWQERWSDSGEVTLWKFAVANLLSEMVDTRGNHMVFNGPEDRIISMIEFYDREEMERYDPFGLQRLCELVKKHFEFTVTIGIGHVQHGIAGIRTSYEQSVAALKRKPVAGRNRVIHFRDIGQEFKSMGFYPNRTIQKAQEYIQENYRYSDLSVEKVASEIFFSPSYLTLLFKKELGMTINDYIIKVRMLEAKNLIEHGDIKLSKVAEMVGYSDISYFSKSFKKFFGVPPSEFMSGRE